MTAEPGTTAPADAATLGPTRARVVWRRLRSDRVAFVALCVIVALVAIAILAPLIVKLAGARAPDAQSTRYVDAGGAPTGPSWHNLFGTDDLGRDVFSRVIYGARVSIEVAVLGTALTVLVGALIGVVAGFYGGWVDTLLSRITDIFLAFPVLLLALGLGAACSVGNGCVGGLIQPGLTDVIVVIAIASWPYVARIVRGQTLSLREQQFVEAARCIGASDRRILTRHILPNLTSTLVVTATVLLPGIVLFEAALSFLGVGVQPPTASWGSMIAGATPIFDSAWWFMVFPGVALLITVLAFNLLGDGLQDALGGHRRGR
jgi:peptide/nickel transport system permease protein